MIISILSNCSPSLMKLSYSNFKYSNIGKNTFSLKISFYVINHVNIISYSSVKRTIVVSLIQT